MARPPPAISRALTMVGVSKRRSWSNRAVLSMGAFLGVIGLGIGGAGAANFVVYGGTHRITVRPGRQKPSRDDTTTKKGIKQWEKSSIRSRNGWQKAALRSAWGCGPCVRPKSPA